MQNNLITLLNQSKIDDLKFESSYEYGGIIVPRVTKIISACIGSEGLLYWANSLGFKHQSYSKTVKLAADIGTQCHNSIDNFINNNFNYDIPGFGFHNESINAYNSYLKWFNDVRNNGNTINVLMNEHSLCCKYFGGTLDGLYEINGKKYIIDYKTSNHVTFRYLLQIAAYRYMLREIHGIEVDGCIILQLSKVDISYNEYILDFNIEEHLKYINDCELTFLSMVFFYYNMMRVESGFKNINWG